MQIKLLMLDSNIWNYLSECKQVINTIHVRIFGPFNCVQTMVILGCKQISSDSFENKIIYELLTYKSYL